MHGRNRIAINEEQVEPSVFCFLSLISSLFLLESPFLRYFSPFLLSYIHLQLYPTSQSSFSPFNLSLALIQILRITNPLESISQLCQLSIALSALLYIDRRHLNLLSIMNRGVRKERQETLTFLASYHHSLSPSLDSHH